MKTVWSRNALPLVPARFQSWYRVLMPITDAGLILFGVSSLLFGSHLVDHAFTDWFSPAWAIATLIGATVALVGLVFLHDRIELVGRFILGLGLLIYVAATAITIFNGDGSASLTLLLTVVKLAGTIWRINDLLSEIALKDGSHAR